MMVVYRCRCVELGTRLGDGCVQCRCVELVMVHASHFSGIRFVEASSRM